MSNAYGAVVSAIVVAVAIIVGILVFQGVATQTGGLQSQITYDAAVLDGAGSWVQLNDGKGTSETVYETTGYAVNLSGANDSYVRATDPVDVATDGNWTVSVWAWADEQDTMTALNIGGEIVVWYDADNSQWSAYHYDAGAREEYRVNVSDSDVVEHFTNVQVVANESHLAIYRNGTLGESKNVSTAASADAPVNATNWDGRLEEVRTFDRALDDANRSALVNSPTDQRPGLNRTARLMFDQPDRETQLFIFADTDLSQSNVTYSAGFDERIMEEDGTLISRDYEWDTDGPRIKPSSGGELDGAPVAYASYTYEGAKHGIIEGFARSINLLALVPIILIAGALVAVVSSMR